MQARAIKRLMQLAPAPRRAAISEGLGLLAENVTTLGADIDLLREEERGRSLWILARQAEEEAAKALILLDLARSDQRDDKGAVRQLKHFYDHLARCIYAEVTQMTPADFAEVRRMVGSMRPSLHLDGPEGFEWIFRNVCSPPARKVSTSTTSPTRKASAGSPRPPVRRSPSAGPRPRSGSWSGRSTVSAR